MEIVLVAAVASNGAIDFPWSIPEDRARFKGLTMNQTVIMGRKTFEAIGRPLDGRRNIVLSKSVKYAGVDTCNSLRDALALCVSDTVYIIGGGSVYEQMIGLADRLEITHLQSEYDGKVFFPVIDSRWKKSSETFKDGYSFATYVR